MFNNICSAVGSTVDLGVFAAGTELLFRLFVEDTGDDFFSGPGPRNADGQAPARVESDYGSSDATLVSFEDLHNGPFDFNDLSLTFTNTLGEPSPVPVPAAFGLLAAALGGLGLLRRKRA